LFDSCASDSAFDFTLAIFDFIFTYDFDALAAKNIPEQTGEGEFMANGELCANETK
jgi:hypothetical protein